MEKPKRKRRTKAELEIETILVHLENQNKLILQILAHIEKEQKQ